jgi:hypothetical protein
MSCLEFEAFLQRSLDEGAIAPLPVDLDRHLVDCSGCRERYQAGQVLLEGLRQLTPPAPPPGLAKQISTRLIRYHRQQRLQRRVAMVGLAASVLAGIVAGVLLSRLKPSVLPIERITKTHEVSPLQQSLAEAGSALVSLTRQAADETIGSTRLFWSDFAPETRAAETPLSALQPPTEPLRDVSQGVSVALEPVATSARRAVDLFLNELPRERDAQPGKQGSKKS